MMKVIEEENVNGMKLVSGEGNKPNAKPTEDGEFIFISQWAIRLTSCLFCRRVQRGLDLR